jgi:hypothetical protein
LRENVGAAVVFFSDVPWSVRELNGTRVRPFGGGAWNDEPEWLGVNVLGLENAKGESGINWADSEKADSPWLESSGDKFSERAGHRG